MSLIVCTGCGNEMFIPNIKQLSRLGICAKCIKGNYQPEPFQDNWSHADIQQLKQIKRNLYNLQNVPLPGDMYSHLTILVASQLIQQLLKIKANRQNGQFRNQNQNHPFQFPNNSSMMNRSSSLLFLNQSQPNNLWNPGNLWNGGNNAERKSNDNERQRKKSQRLRQNQRLQQQRSQQQRDNYLLRITQQNDKIFNEPRDYQPHIRRQRQRNGQSSIYSQQIVHPDDLSQFSSTVNENFHYQRQ